MQQLVGRKEESSILSECVNSNSSELIAVYGRRRVGKTFLVRSVYKDNLYFEITGIYNASLKIQLSNFSQSLADATKKKVDVSVPNNWLDAMQKLKNYVISLKIKQKKVLFFDELPWLDSRRSGFLAAFEHFWNSWASQRSDLIIVVCGSAASWMIKQLVNSKGGLHNRITRKIRLLPFTLLEMEEYLKSNQILLDRYQLLQLYMVTGGIPHYLKEVKRGESVVQMVDRVCFSKDGLLFSEFDNLYKALYENPEKHISIIKALASKRSGLTRSEIITMAKSTTGGTITKVLDELAESGFITPYLPFDRKNKDAIFRLTDEYSLFYLKFIDGTRAKGTGSWMLKSTSQSWKSWSGYTFESICLKHSQQIKKALGIEGIYSEESAWRLKDINEGTQIDMVIDRRDQCINLCEIKFSEFEFEINKTYALQLENKIKIFRKTTKTRKSIFLTLITTYGLKLNKHQASLVTNTITLDELFY